MATDQVPLWEVFEKAFPVKKDFPNPFRDVELAVFFRRGSVELRMDGFYDGAGPEGETWRVRFAPSRAGDWTWSTRSTEPSLDGLCGGFRCVDPVGRGGLTTDPRFPNWFFREDGGAQFIVNDGWTPHPGSAYGIEKYGPQYFSYPDEGKYRTFMDILARHRVNMVVDLRQLYARQETITDTSYLWPWKVVDPARHRIDRDRFNLAYFQRLDRHILHAQSRGIFLGVELLYDNAAYRRAEWSHHPWNARNGGWLEDWDGGGAQYVTDQLPFGWHTHRLFDLKNATHLDYVGRYLAYTAARTAAYWNVFYAMGCESSNIYPGAAEKVDAWFTHWGDFLAARDPHRRLCSIGDVGSRVQGPRGEIHWDQLTPSTGWVYQNARNTMNTTQEHTVITDRVQYAQNIHGMGLRFWRFRRPTIIGEQDGRNNQKYPMERVGFWSAFSSGYFMGRIDRHYDLTDGGTRLFESKLFSLPGDPGIYDDMKRMADFVDGSGVRFWRMMPADDLLDAASPGVFCLAEEGEEYLFYFTQGGRASLKLPDRPFRARWFNPRTGEFGAEKTLQGAEPTAFEAPDAEDWVLHAVRG